MWNMNGQMKWADDEDIWRPGIFKSTYDQFVVSYDNTSIEHGLPSTKPTHSLFILGKKKISDTQKERKEMSKYKVD